MIFCIEDDHSIRDLMIYTLNASGFQAEGFTNASSLFHTLQTEIPQLILLDLMLADEDGISILKKLKSNMITSNIPVIIASAKGTEYDKVLGLDLGADDYLVKPFGMMEMLSRIKAVLRRTTPKETAHPLRIGSLELNTEEHTVYEYYAESSEEEITNSKDKMQMQLIQKGNEYIKSKSFIELTLKEFELLRLFMAHPGIVFTRDVLLDKIWASDYLGGTRTVDVHIGSLRTKLGAYGSLIKTVRGVGYIIRYFDHGCVVQSVSGAALLLFDVTEKEKAEQMRREFTANVSHELKTPLHSISGYAELLKNGLVKPADICPFADRIYTEAQRMAKLVEDIMNLSHLDEGAADMTLETQDLLEAARSVIRSLSQEAADILLHSVPNEGTIITIVFPEKLSP